MPHWLTDVESCMHPSADSVCPFVARLSVPDSPASAELAVINGESLQLNWTAPFSDGGAGVQSYRVSG
eukprot:37415-Eustigmatos_ZCMA.PRE.1